MMIATICIPDPNSHIQTILQSEISDMQMPRSTITLSQKDLQLVVNIKAKDAVALRATINAVCKQVAIYEKMQQIQ